MSINGNGFLSVASYGILHRKYIRFLKLYNIFCEKNILTVEMWDFWEEITVQAFREAIMQHASLLAVPLGEHLTLLDITKLKILPQESRYSLQRMGHDRLSGRKMAFVIGEGLGKIQTRYASRIKGNFAKFTSVVAAKHWLLSENNLSIADVARPA